jgi:penicillin-binding protein-related factor A (putative recombinase)
MAFLQKERVMKNTGKIFEEDIKKSVDRSRCLIIRIPDPPQSFTKRDDTSFSVKNPCDFIVFDSKTRILFPMELKSTKFKSMSFESENEKDTSKMIKWHQIDGLLKYSTIDYVIPCFILNFRDEKNKMQRTYSIYIKQFVGMINKLDKKSFNEIDLINNGAVKIHGEIKRTRYRWNLSNTFDVLADRYIREYKIN